MREIRAHLTDPRVLGGLVVVAAILGFSGPFGTFQYLSTVPRVLYWAAVVGGTYCVGTVVAMTAGAGLRRQLARPAARIVLLGFLIGPPVTLTVFLINLLAFGVGGFQPIDWLTLLINCTLIAMGVNAISEIIGGAISRPAGTGAGAQAVAPAPPPILERIPVHLRGPLVSLSVADHYVEVVTQKGKAMVLMRLGDAIREVGGTAGVQIHRSHWVALDAVADVSRTAGKVTVTLRDQRTLPVSRGYMNAARDAGLVV